MAETKSKNQRDVIIKSLRGKFNDEMANTEHKDVFAVALIDFSINIHTIKEESYKNEKTTVDPNTKVFKPIKLEPIKDDLLPNIVLSYDFDEKRNSMNFKSQSGMFKIKFSDGSMLYFAQRLVGMGKNLSVESYAVAHKKTLDKYYRYLKAQLKINSKPKVGLFKISTVQTPFGEKLNYEPIQQKDFKKNIVFHQNKEMVADDIKQFFENLGMYTRFSQPGSRRLLLIGEPGGGKTSAAMLIAQDYSKDMCVVVASSLKSVMMHTFNISKAKMPTLVILEDAEATIPWGDSGVLNFLDGINQPKTEKGCYMILTTNFPQRLEPRILKRPGRIDKIIKFGALDEMNSIMCVKHYFDGILFDSKKDNKKKIEEILRQVYEEIILDKSNGGTMTGAQIKNLSESTIAYSISKRIENVTVDVLKKVSEALIKDLKDVYEMADEESMSKERMDPVGYAGTTQKRSYGEEINWETIMNPKIKGHDNPF